jgi:hypothetical protein
MEFWASSVSTTTPIGDSVANGREERMNSG